jgi:PAS domain S-box-containing protein
MFRTGSEHPLFPSLQATPADIRIPRSPRFRTAVVEWSTDVATRAFLVQLLAVFVAYFIAGKLGQATTNIRSSNLGPVWPAYGVALAVFLKYGYRVWPAVISSAFLVALQSSVPSLAAAGQATAATVAAATGSLLLRRIPNFDPSLPRLRDALGLMVLGAFGSALLSSSFGILSLYATGIQPYSGIASAWLVYWLGDSTGVLLVTPLVFTLPQLLGIQSRARMAELLALVALTVFGGFVVFGDFFQVHLDVFAFAMLPLVMWAGIDFGIAGATLSVFLIATIATILTALGFGPFAANTAFANAVLLDVLFTLLAVSGLALASVITERERAESERERLIRARAEVEARLRHAAVVESSDDAILSEDLNGVVLSWNQAASRMFGFAEPEAIGRPISQLLPPELLSDEVTVLENLRAGERLVHLERTRTAASGENIHLSSTISPLRDGAGRLVGTVRSVRDISERKRAEEALARAKRKLVRVQEQERARIARELHDDIGQRLALLTVGLTSVSEELRTQASEIAADLQSLSHELHPSKIEVVGAVTGMRVFCSEFATQHQFDVNFEASDVTRQLSSNISLSLFRILQEALHNTSKHSGVRQCRVRLWEAHGWVHLVVTDEGKGFDPAAMQESRGIGLITMQERVSLADGDLRIESQPGRGTTVHARVPITDTDTPNPAGAELSRVRGGVGSANLFDYLVWVLAMTPT